MDPKAALDRAARAIEDGYFDDAEEAIGDYVMWRRKGGFEPPGGDERLRRIRKDLRFAKQGFFENPAGDGRDHEPTLAELIDALELYNDNTDSATVPRGGEKVYVFFWEPEGGRDGEWQILSHVDPKKHQKEYGGRYAEVRIPGHEGGFNAFRAAVDALRTLGIKVTNPEMSVPPPSSMTKNPYEVWTSFGDRTIKNREKPQLVAIRLVLERDGWRVDFTETVAGAWMPWEAALHSEVFKTKTAAEKAAREWAAEENIVLEGFKERKKNPAGLTAKGERMYEHVKESYAGDPRAKEIAARTVLARAGEGTPGLKKNSHERYVVEHITSRTHSSVREPFFGIIDTHEGMRSWRNFPRFSTRKAAQQRADFLNLKKNPSNVAELGTTNDPDYNWYVVAVDRPVKVIFSGWEFRDDARDDLLENGEFYAKKIGSPVKLVSLKTLEKLGVDPDNEWHWHRPIRPNPRRPR